MKHTYILLIAALFAAKQDIYAQGYATDALRFSQYEYGSSARVKGLGNAQTALGGDISSLAGNPAGLGLFTKSQLSLSPEIFNYNTKSGFFGQNTDASRGRIGINSIAAAFPIIIGKAKGKALDKGALSLTFGLGYNKTADFGNKIAFTGINTQGTIAGFYAELGNNSTGTNLASGSIADAAYNGNLINYTNGRYSVATDLNPTQSEILIRKGSLSEFNLAAAMNISNQFYIGASVGILGLNYSSDNTFTEKGTLSYSDTRGDYKENYANNYYQRYEAKGTGLNAKVGIIFRPDSHVRLGANVQTPNWYTIDDSYSESIQTRLTNNPYFTDQDVKSQVQTYDLTYSLKTPAKFSLGLTLLESKVGLISADVDFVDYSSMELKEKDYEFSNTFVEDNRIIVNNFKNTMNYRFGGEVKVSPVFMLRSGYSITGSPYENDKSAEIKTLSFGAGYRSGNLSFDIAYQNTKRDASIEPYYVNSVAGATAATQNTKSGIFLTLSTRF